MFRSRTSSESERFSNGIRQRMLGFVPIARSKIEGAEGRALSDIDYQITRTPG